MVYKRIIWIAGWLFCLSLFQAKAQEDTEQTQNHFENTDLPMNIREDLEQYNKNIDAKIDSLRQDLERLEFQMVRTYGKVKYRTLKEAKNAQEQDLVLTDTVITDQLTGEEELAVSSDELDQPIDTSVFPPGAAMDDTLVIPPAPPVDSEYQAVNDLDEFRKDLNQLSQRVIFHRKSFANALITHEWLEAERLRTDLEIMLEEIETGIETIRGEMSDFH
jgi:hypothetical protein